MKFCKINIIIYTRKWFRRNLQIIVLKNYTSKKLNCYFSFDMGRRESIVPSGREESPGGLLVPLGLLLLYLKGKEGDFGHTMTWGCVFQTWGDRGKRQSLCFEQPEPEASGVRRACMLLNALYLSLGREVPAKSSSQVCKLALLLQEGKCEVELNMNPLAKIT